MSGEPSLSTDRPANGGDHPVAAKKTMIQFRGRSATWVKRLVRRGFCHARCLFASSVVSVAGANGSANYEIQNGQSCQSRNWDYKQDQQFHDTYAKHSVRPPSSNGLALQIAERRRDNDSVWIRFQHVFLGRIEQCLSPWSPTNGHVYSFPSRVGALRSDELIRFG
jgi:hypothetical protein